MNTRNNAENANMIDTSQLSEAEERHYQPKEGGLVNLILKTASSIIVYFIAMISFYLYMAGHNAPGGGFIAGLMLAGGGVLLYLSYGKPFADNIKFDYKLLIPIGLTISLCCGLGGVVFGYPFLTHTFGHFSIPFFGDVELATAAIFDLGVYLVVVGTALTIIMNIGGNK